MTGLINFYSTQVKTVLDGIFQTIRYDKTLETERMQQNALRCSEDSLVKMVKDYIVEHNPDIDPEELATIEKSAKYGDLSPIMPDYTKEIINPLKNAFFGEFIRLILIQIQKQKVDVERTMLQLNQVIKANQLNFNLLAAVPGALSIYLLYKFIIREKTYTYLHGTIRDIFREVHILLNKNLNKDREITEKLSNREELEALTISNLLRCEELGLLLVGLYRLSILGEGLPTRQKKWFLQDLREIQNEQYTIEQRLNTMHRMYGIYPFLAIR